MIVVVSDIHLGYERCNREDFKEFIHTLNNREIGHLILLGDILDFWRSSPHQATEENNDILSALEDLDTTVSYVVGNHDFLFIDSQLLPLTFTKTLTLESGSRTFQFIHGYQIEFHPVLDFYEGICQALCTVEGGTKEILNVAWDYYQHNLQQELGKSEHRACWQTLTRSSLDPIIRYLLTSPEDEPLHTEITQARVSEYREGTGMDPKDILIYGHTHHPYIYEREANAGCWIQNSHMPNSYLTIKDGEITLHYWRPQKVIL